MIKVYVLEFTRTYADREDTELSIGTYTTEAKAQAARGMLNDKKGFREHPSGFTIHEIELDLTGWQDGFITRSGNPPKDAGGKAFDLPAWSESFPFQELAKTGKQKLN